MEPIVRLDMLLVASMCLCGAVAVMAWMGLYRAILRARISLSLLVMAVALGLWAASNGPLGVDSEHERLLIWFTPFLCLLALTGLILMILALRNTFFPSRYRGDEDEYDPW
jgi:hypothetical protein